MLGTLKRPMPSLTGRGTDIFSCIQTCSTEADWLSRVDLQKDCCLCRQVAGRYVFDSWMQHLLVVALPMALA